MTETVGFTSMAEGTREDYLLLQRLEERMVAGLPDRLLRALDALRDSFDGYQVTRYEHSLQAAGRALRDGRDEEYVVATLLHDLGDELAPHNHGELAAAIRRPYVRDEVHWIIQHHGAFQMYYYAHHYAGTGTSATGGPITPGTRRARSSASGTTRSASTRRTTRCPSARSSRCCAASSPGRGTARLTWCDMDFLTNRGDSGTRPRVRPLCRLRGSRRGWDPVREQ